MVCLPCKTLPLHRIVSAAGGHLFLGVHRHLACCGVVITDIDGMNDSPCSRFRFQILPSSHETQPPSIAPLFSFRRQCVVDLAVWTCCTRDVIDTAKCLQLSVSPVRTHLRVTLARSSRWFPSGVFLIISSIILLTFFMLVDFLTVPRIASAPEHRLTTLALKWHGCVSLVLFAAGPASMRLVVNSSSSCRAGLEHQSSGMTAVCAWPVLRCSHQFDFVLLGAEGSHDPESSVASD